MNRTSLFKSLVLVFVVSVGCAGNESSTDQRSSENHTSSSNDSQDQSVEATLVAKSNTASVNADIFEKDKHGTFVPYGETEILDLPRVDGAIVELDLTPVQLARGVSVDSFAITYHAPQDQAGAAVWHTAHNLETNEEAGRVEIVNGRYIVSGGALQLPSIRPFKIAVFNDAPAPIVALIQDHDHLKRIQNNLLEGPNCSWDIKIEAVTHFGLIRSWCSVTANLTNNGQVGLPTVSLAGEISSIRSSGTISGSVIGLALDDDFAFEKNQVRRCDGFWFMRAFNDPSRARAYAGVHVMGPTLGVLAGFNLAFQEFRITNYQTGLTQVYLAKFGGAGIAVGLSLGQSCETVVQGPITYIQ